MNKDFVIPEPSYIYGEEEAIELAEIENTIESKGPLPFRYSNIKKAKEIVLKYRSKYNLGNTIQIMPNPKLGKMKRLDFSLSNAHCPYTGIWFGRYMGINNDIHRWIPVSISSTPRILNLEKDDDVADWMVFRLFKGIKGSYYNNLLGEKPLFYIQDDRAEMTQGFDNAELIVSTIEKVKNLSPEMLLMVARQLGINLSPGVEKSVGSKEILGFVLKITIENAKSVIDLIDNAAASIYSVLSSALFSGIIFADHTGFTYKGRLLGRTKEEVISTLQTDPKTFQLISIQARTADKLAIRIEKEMNAIEDILPDDEDNNTKSKF